MEYHGKSELIYRLREAHDNPKVTLMMFNHIRNCIIVTALDQESLDLIPDEFEGFKVEKDIRGYVVAQ